MEDLIGYLDEIQSQLTFASESRGPGSVKALRPRCAAGSPALDTDSSGLGVGFIYPGNVRFSSNTTRANSSEFRYR
jgi:hypothetical protein